MKLRGDNSQFRPVFDKVKCFFSASEPGAGDEMKIAWRYQNQATVTSTDTTTATGSTHSFNLQKTLSKSVLEQCDVNSWSQPTFESDVDDYYRDAFVKLSAVAETESFSVTPQSSPDVTKNILRVALQNVGSTMWCDDCDATSLSKFIFALRSLARHHLAIVVITTSRASLVTQNEASLARVRSLCDVVIQLTPFSKEERKTGLFKDHHGVLVTLDICTGKNLPSISVLLVAPTVEHFAAIPKVRIPLS